nr:MAG TPA: hypothetical protein [Caudoviricetes sp.]
MRLMQPLSGAQHSVRTDCYTINVRTMLME